MRKLFHLTRPFGRGSMTTGSSVTHTPVLLSPITTAILAEEGIGTPPTPFSPLQAFPEKTEFDVPWELVPDQNIGTLAYRKFRSSGGRPATREGLRKARELVKHPSMDSPGMGLSISPHVMPPGTMSQLARESILAYKAAGGGPRADAVSMLKSRRTATIEASIAEAKLMAEKMGLPFAGAVPISQQKRITESIRIPVPLVQQQGLSQVGPEGFEETLPYIPGEGYYGESGPMPVVTESEVNWKGVSDKTLKTESSLSYPVEKGGGSPASTAVAAETLPYTPGEAFLPHLPREPQLLLTGAPASASASASGLLKNPLVLVGILGLFLLMRK